MERPLHAQPHKSTVALVRWSKKPGENPVIRFIILTVFGLILCLFLMIFMPGLRSGGAVALFTVSFAALLTIPAVSGQRTFMRGLTQRVNDTIAEVSDSPGDQLSVGEFRRLIKSGEPLPLLVGGVPGLSLHVERVATAEENAPQKWLAVFTVVPPENGAASFDRLVAAAIDADRGVTGTSGTNPS
ncbi:hypothetical protein J2X01_000272 [Arthrobacter ginsengisoli]|uniref:Uncharacterized protein n=1 Tax=Arthrobacter ginsengisoli TaxID=1356565 RepID=A0ABU1U730_9MICC|nr:hypothetical protein [Arthrobacter ginsengisoli]MDR7081003.1 hypothetical protein [Arthrobacter ginsengisoli]